MKCDVHGVEGCKSDGCKIWLESNCPCGDPTHCGIKKHSTAIRPMNAGEMMWREASASEGIILPEGLENIDLGDKNFAFAVDSNGKTRMLYDEKPKGFQNIVLSWINRHIWIEVELGSNKSPKRIWKW